jgi:hypothetical protein
MGVEIDKIRKSERDSLSFLHNLNDKTKLHNSLHTVSFFNSSC